MLCITYQIPLSKTIFPEEFAKPLIDHYLKRCSGLKRANMHKNLQGSLPPKWLLKS